MRTSLRSLVALAVVASTVACGGNVVVDPNGTSTGTGGASGSSATTSSGTAPSDACGASGPVNPAACVTTGATCMAPQGKDCMTQWTCTSGSWSSVTECPG
jgi:hypothetical protein